MVDNDSCGRCPDPLGTRPQTQFCDCRRYSASIPITVTIATPSDIPDLCGLLNTLFTQEPEFKPDSALQTKGLAAIIEEEKFGHILVVRDGVRVIGMVNLLYTISTALGARVAILEDFVIGPKDRNRGVGSQLMRAAIAHARANGCERITLLTDGINVKAQEFYRKHGFKGSEMVPFRLHL